MEFQVGLSFEEVLLIFICLHVRITEEFEVSLRNLATLMPFIQYYRQKSHQIVILAIAVHVIIGDIDVLENLLNKLVIKTELFILFLQYVLDQCRHADVRRDIVLIVRDEIRLLEKFDPLVILVIDED